MIPGSFKLAGHTYSVERMRLDRDRGSKGECFSDQLTICIAGDVPESGQQETFWHEVIEAINATYDLGLDHRAITTLGAGVHQVVTTQEGSVD